MITLVLLAAACAGDASPVAAPTATLVAPTGTAVPIPTATLVAPTGTAVPIPTVTLVAPTGTAVPTPTVTLVAPTGTAVPTPTSLPSEPPATAVTSPIVVTQGPSDPPRVALTFDAGSDAGFTSDILDTLAAADVPATFALTGEWAAAHPDLVRRIAADGHILMNHSYDHPSFTGYSTGEAALSAEQMAMQLERADEVITELAGVSTEPWFRPPYGDHDAAVDGAVASAGYRYIVMWSVDSGGWQGLAADTIVERVVGDVTSGAIVVFHVGSQSQDAAALPAIIDRLRANGYELVDLQVLLGLA